MKYIRAAFKWLGGCSGCATDRQHAELAILRVMLREERRQLKRALEEIRILRNDVYGVPDSVPKRIPKRGEKSDV